MISAAAIRTTKANRMYSLLLLEFMRAAPGMLSSDGRKPFYCRSDLTDDEQRRPRQHQKRDQQQFDAAEDQQQTGRAARRSRMIEHRFRDFRRIVVDVHGLPDRIFIDNLL